MGIIKAFSRRSLLWLLVLNLVLLAIIDAAVYAGFFPGLAEPLSKWGRTLFFPATAALFVFMSLIQWAVIRGILKRLVHRNGSARETSTKNAFSGQKKASEPQEPGLSRKEIQKQNQRYYLHLLSVLQRQGRLVDFLKEDLSAYSDAQIGAAVRSVHENCAKTVEKYLAPQGIIDKTEGQEVTIDSDFDPSSIKLTGNVTGEPPFTGILRHPGWRAKKLELPVLSETGDPGIIASAEVEVS
ncbi:MAG: DUF2760 domain-containing protein [Desulfobacteraceae bacterium]|nr:DUF2760 domain-containing protein [Desulfobacteraceae bacterium]